MKLSENQTQKNSNVSDTTETAYYKSDLKRARQYEKLHQSWEKTEKNSKWICAVLSLVIVIALLIISFQLDKPYGAMAGIFVPVRCAALSIISIILGVYGLKTKLWWLSIISFIVNTYWWVANPSRYSYSGSLGSIYLILILCSAIIILVFFAIAQIIKKHNQE